ncbi:protein TrsL, partial [Lactiplantibacillus plantarum]
MGDMISKAINSFLEGIIKGALKWIINILTGTVKLLNTNMNEIAVYYGIFLGFATSLVLVVVLARIIMTI